MLCRAPGRLSWSRAGASQWDEAEVAAHAENKEREYLLPLPVKVTGAVTLGRDTQSQNRKLALCNSTESQCIQFLSSLSPYLNISRLLEVFSRQTIEASSSPTEIRLGKLSAFRQISLRGRSHYCASVFGLWLSCTCMDTFGASSLLHLTDNKKLILVFCACSARCLQCSFTGN